MDPNYAVGHRHRRSPSSSDRFISVFSPRPSAAGKFDASSAGDELNEVDIFYTSDFSDESRSGQPDAADHRFAPSIHQPEKFGILAALPEDRRKSDAVVLKPALYSPPAAAATFARDIPAIPKPHSSSEGKFSQSMPVRRFQQSAPVNVPMMARRLRSDEPAFEAEAEEEEEEEVLPPHEMVARVSLRNQKTTFSVLEGVGRTLKGRDLRQVRNAVWRQTGFLNLD